MDEAAGTRYSKGQAAKLIRECLEQEDGGIIPTKHFLEELAKEHLDMADALYVLKYGGVYDEPELNPRHGQWTYKIEGTEPEGKLVAIIFCFQTAEVGVLITIFEITTT